MRARRALYATGTDVIDVALNWLLEHDGDADIDTPLLVKKRLIKPKLSKEEARAQAEELRRTIVAKREKEEKESERLREKERIRAGKELAKEQALKEDQERKRNIDWRRREKEEEARAKARILEKLAEDKKARRRKAGLPEDESPEELAAAAAAKTAKDEAAAADKASKAGAAAAASQQRAKMGSLSEKLRAELVALKRCALGRGEPMLGALAGPPPAPDAPNPAGEERARAAFSLLMTLVGNVAQAPGEEKYRRVKMAGAAFSGKLALFPASLRFLGLLGFLPDAAGEFLVMQAGDVNVLSLHAAGQELHGALENPYFGVL